MKIIRKILREILLKWRSPPRYVLERKIFPKINGKKILLVGVAHYTANYPRLLGEDKRNELWTIDIDPKMKEFGAKKHIVDDITNVDKHFKKGFFDVIVMVGVFGYGLDIKKGGEKALKACFNVLKAGGKFIIGWSDFEPHDKSNPEKLKNFKLFKRASFYGFNSCYRTKDNKIFEFLIKE